MRWGFIIVVAVIAAGAWLWEPRDGAPDVELVTPNAEVTHEAPPPVVALESSGADEPVALTGEAEDAPPAPAVSVAPDLLVGLVVNERDEPLAGATVTNVDTRKLIATTNTVGEFTLPADVEIGTDLLVEFERHRQQCHNLSDEEHAREVPLRITLVSGAVVSLRVADADGLPVADALVMWEGGDNVHPSNIYAPFEVIVRYQLQTSRRSGNVVTRTDAAGIAQLGGVTDDIGGVLIESAVHAPFVLAPIELAGADVDLGTVTLARTRTFRGTVTNEFGEPIADAHVGVVCEEISRMRLTTTDATGRFEVEGIPDVGATIDVGVWHDDFDTFELRDANPDVSIEAHLRERLTVDLALIDGVTGIPISSTVSVVASASPLDPRVIATAPPTWTLEPDGVGLVTIDKIDRRDPAIQMSCEGYRDLVLSLDREWSLAAEMIELWPVGDMNIRVVDALTGLGLADARFSVVHVERIEGSTSMTHMTVTSKPGASDGDYLVGQEAFPAAPELNFSVNVEGYEGTSLKLEEGEVMRGSHTFSLLPSDDSPSKGGVFGR